MRRKRCSASISRCSTRGGVAEELPRKALETAAREGRFEAEGWRVRKDGARFWANVVIDPIRDPSGGLVGFAKVTRDLTERRKAEEALRLSEERFRLLMESVTDYAIYMLDARAASPTGTPAAKRLQGLRAEEIVGRHFSKFYTEEDKAAGLPQLGLQTAAREGRFEKEGVRIRKDGSRFWAHVVIEPIRDATGALVGFAKVVRDVTERKQAERRLEEAREALFQSQKLEAVGRLTGGVAHDFNNLLTVVLGSLEMLERKLPDEPSLKRLLARAVEGARRGASLTQRMLVFARQRELDPKAVDLVGLGARHGRSDEALARRNDPAAGSTCPRAAARGARRQPVRTGAAQPAGQRARRHAEGRDGADRGARGAHRRARRRAAGGALRLRQRDRQRRRHGRRDLAQGEGAVLHHQGRRQGHRPRTVDGARGRRAIERCAGAQERSRQGHDRGALAARRAGGRSRTRDQTPKRTRQAASSILAVDDDPLVLMNTVAMLEEMGHRVLQATRGAEALEILRRLRAVDLLLTDVMMPEMTGVELARRASEARPNLPILLVTGYADLPPGGQKLPRLTKPFSLAELADAVKEAMGSRAAPEAKCRGAPSPERGSAAATTVRPCGACAGGTGRRSRRRR